MHTDFDSALACLKCLHAILVHHQNAVDASVDIPRIIKYVLVSQHVPAMAQPIRHEVFNLVHTIFDNGHYVRTLRLESRSNEMEVENEEKAIMDDGFAKTFASAMEGEKDPRCLILCLNLAGLICDRLPLDDSESFERIFDVCSVYFPISFTPPPNDPYGIKKEDLVSALEGMMVSSVALAQHVLPIVIESLGNPDEEIDASRTLQKCAEKFPRMLSCLTFIAHERCFMLHARKAKDTDSVSAALQCIRALVKSLALPGKAHLGWSRFVVPLIKDCADAIRESVDSMIGRSVAPVLAAIASASPGGMSCVLEATSFVLPMAMELESAVQRTACFETLSVVLGAIDADVEYPPATNPLLKIATPTLSFFCKELNLMVEDKTKESAAVVACARNLLVRPKNCIGTLVKGDLMESIVSAWTALSLSGGTAVSSIAGNAIVQLGVRSATDEHFLGALRRIVLPKLFENISKMSLLILVALGSMDHLRKEVVPGLCARAFMEDGSFSDATSCSLVLDALRLLFTSPTTSDYGKTLGKDILNAAAHGPVDRTLGERC